MFFFNVCKPDFISINTHTPDIYIKVQTFLCGTNHWQNYLLHSRQENIVKDFITVDII